MSVKTTLNIFSLDQSHMCVASLELERHHGRGKPMGGSREGFSGDMARVALNHW